MSQDVQQTCSILIGQVSLLLLVVALLSCPLIRSHSMANHQKIHFVSHKWSLIYSRETNSSWNISQHTLHTKMFIGIRSEFLGQQFGDQSMSDFLKSSDFLLTFVIFRFLDPINDFFPNLLFSTARSRLVQGSPDQWLSTGIKSGNSCLWISVLFIIPILHMIIKISGIRKQTTHLWLVFTTGQSEFSIGRTNQKTIQKLSLVYNEVSACYRNLWMEH